ncbi:aspartate 1-decarboxylase [Candidatus Dependentiae bacterium]|nr:aspartate 1-decarboxylase [Candidatus Dependentiae bacterium]
MKVKLLKSKIHQATVTRTNIKYEGSIEIDEELMKKAGFVEWEKVLVVNIANGKRFETYIIKGAPGSRIISLQGGAARLGEVGDRLIIFSFASLSPDELKDFQPTILHLDEDNNIINK